MYKSSEVQTKEVSARKEYYHSLSNQPSSLPSNQNTNSKRVGSKHVKGQSSLYVTEGQQAWNVPGKGSQLGKELK